jgi:hypothetical protein
MGASGFHTKAARADFQGQSKSNWNKARIVQDAIVLSQGWKYVVDRLDIFSPRSTVMELIPGNSLITADAEAGRALAVKMSRLIIKLTQPDEAVRNKLRDVYANDAAMLLAAGQTVAAEFATIAAANNYWRDIKR